MNLDTSSLPASWQRWQNLMFRAFQETAAFRDDECTQRTSSLLALLQSPQIYLLLPLFCCSYSAAVWQDEDYSIDHWTNHDLCDPLSLAPHCGPSSR